MMILIRKMRWTISHRAELRSRLIADRHYNRQKPGTSNFVPPGRCVVLYTGGIGAQALWVTSYPYAEYVKHAWAGAWLCSAFRNENAGRASDLIVTAVSATRHIYGDPPALGMVTFINKAYVKPTLVRGREVWGWTFMKAGFVPCGSTKGGLLAFQLLPDKMPGPRPPLQR